MDEMFQYKLARAMYRHCSAGADPDEAIRGNALTEFLTMQHISTDQAHAQVLCQSLIAAGILLPLESKAFEGQFEMYVFHEHVMYGKQLLEEDETALIEELQRSNPELSNKVRKSLSRLLAFAIVTSWEIGLARPVCICAAAGTYVTSQ